MKNYLKALSVPLLLTASLASQTVYGAASTDVLLDIADNNPVLVERLADLAKYNPKQLAKIMEMVDSDADQVEKLLNLSEADPVLFSKLLKIKRVSNRATKKPREAKLPSNQMRTFGSIDAGDVIPN